MAYQSNITDTTQSNNSEQSGDTQPSQTPTRPKFGELTPFVTERQRLYFSGLDTVSTVPAPVQESPITAPEPQTLNEIIHTLPQAQEGSLKAVNPFVGDDSIDTTEIAHEVGIENDDLSVDLEDIERESPNVVLDDYKIIIDPNRARLNALDPRIKFWWNVTTDGSGRSYTIINPPDAYWPAYKTFKEKGKENNIFGWVEQRDYGGEVDMFILFDDHTIPHPDEEDAEIYIGFQTGYNFTSSRAFDVILFGYDPVNDVRLYSLGERRSRRHVGDPNSPEKEREEGRTPIKDWWDEEYENLLQWTDDLVQDIQRATETTIDLDEFDFDLTEFYKYLDIPKTYATDTDNGPGAVHRAERHSPHSSVYTMWTLYYGLSQTLEDEFKGSDRSATNSTYKVYADIATTILRNPHKTILKAKRAHREEMQNDGATTNPIATDEQDNIESVSDIDGVSTEDRLNLTQKRDIANETQQKLFPDE